MIFGSSFYNPHTVSHAITHARNHPEKTVVERRETERQASKIITYDSPRAFWIFFTPLGNEILFFLVLRFPSKNIEQGGPVNWVSHSRFSCSLPCNTYHNHIITWLCPVCRAACSELSYSPDLVSNRHTTTSITISNDFILVLWYFAYLPSYSGDLYSSSVPFLLPSTSTFYSPHQTPKDRRITTSFQLCVFWWNMVITG